jgi:hypothetical protein
MAATQSSHLLGPPAELRLQVYEYFVTDSLSYGETYDITGLFLFCRQVYQELNAEYISKFRALSHAKYKWQKNDFPGGTLRMNISPSLNVSTDKAELSIAVEDMMSDTDGRYVDSLKAGADSLRLVFASPWSVLNFSLDSAEYGGASLDPSNERFETVFEILAKMRAAAPEKLRINRSVLSFGRGKYKIGEDRFNNLIQMFGAIRKKFKKIYGSELVERAWMAKTEPGWQLPLDLEEDLGHIKVALLMLMYDSGLMS